VKITYDMRVCVKCRTDATSERLACLRCSLRFCSHSALLNDDGQCKVCKQELAEIRSKRVSAA
jgi:hypothetical protein